MSRQHATPLRRPARLSLPRETLDNRKRPRVGNRKWDTGATVVDAESGGRSSFRVGTTGLKVSSASEHASPNHAPEVSRSAGTGAVASVAFGFVGWWLRWRTGSSFDMGATYEMERRRAG